MQSVVRTTQIKLLPDHLINQIAAGEVIERPASVVKELLDNSLDAGASKIVIDVEQGGVGLIRVKDNGMGIHRDDLKLALTRHATSKIAQLNDLQHLITMGFRGEALPSIASISRLIITSAFQESDHAWVIKSEGREDLTDIEPEPASHPVGTTIEIRDLFFNVPARRKYLRTERTEFYQIQQLVRHFSISHPEISVRLTHNGRQIFDLKSIADDGGKTRVSDVCGTRFMQNAYPVDQQDRDIKLTGWVGNADAARTMNDAQFFCLNGRCIKDKRINHAIVQAYQDILSEGRYAAFALNLQMDPAMVDVNVHPAKTEVRFREGRSIHDFIYSALNRVLSDQKTIRYEVQNELKNAIPNLRSISVQHSKSRPSYLQENNRGKVKESDAAYFPDFKIIEETQTKTSQYFSQKDEQSFDPRITIIGDVLLVKKGDHLILINIKEASAAMCLERLQRELKNGTVKSKPLLFPFNINLEKNDLKLIEEHSKLLLEIGIVLSESESGEMQLRQIPAAVSIQNYDQFVIRILSLLNKDIKEKKSELINFLAKYHSENYILSETQKFVDEIDQSLSKEKSQNWLRKLSYEEILIMISDQ
ncbi:MAG: DNA mismatch repair endonuclease MutL [Gammaproteobacteria bacterium]